MACKAQKLNHMPAAVYYKRSHALIDDIFEKGNGNFVIPKMYDFNSHVNLGNSILYDKMITGGIIRYNKKTKVKLDLNIIELLLDKSHWISSDKTVSYDSWDSSLFPKSDLQTVEQFNKQRDSSSRAPFYFIPLGINFKENLALIEYQGLSGKVLKAYNYVDGSWELIAFANEYQERQE